MSILNKVQCSRICHKVFTHLPGGDRSVQGHQAGQVALLRDKHAGETNRMHSGRLMGSGQEVISPVVWWSSEWVLTDVSSRWRSAPLTASSSGSPTDRQGRREKEREKEGDIEWKGGSDVWRHLSVQWTSYLPSRVFWGGTCLCEGMFCMLCRYLKDQRARNVFY